VCEQKTVAMVVKYVFKRKTNPENCVPIRISQEQVRAILNLLL